MCLGLLACELGGVELVLQALGQLADALGEVWLVNNNDPNDKNEYYE